MGRPMGQVDPAAGPVQQFAAGLRELREQAGNPTFRQLAQHAHYSATTLSQACSGRSLPSLDVVLALVRACDGAEDLWRRRWHGVAAQNRAMTDQPSEPARHPKPGISLRRLLPWAGWVAATAAVALLLVVTTAGRQAAAGPSRQPASAWAGLPMYVGVTRCDPGSYPVLRTTMTLPRPVEIGGRAFQAGAVVGTVYLMYSPRCSEGWPHFSPSGAFFNQPGRLTLSSRSTPDNSLNTSPQYPVIRYADGEPMLTVLGCVDAEATIEFDGSGPPVTAATPCFQRA